MSATLEEAASPPAGAGGQEAPVKGARFGRVEGFGMACGSDAWVAEVFSEDDVRDLFTQARAAGHSVTFRGSGASYGDAALNTDRVVCDITQMRRILSFNPETGVVRAQAGVTVEDLWRKGIAHGFWPPVVSGTMVPTMGGAVAMNIHGKNCWKTGPIGEHLRELRVLLPSGELVDCGPEKKPELFEAVVGGFGMLGCVTEVELQLKRLHSGMLEVVADSAPDLDAVFDCCRRYLDDYEYVVGWLDTFPKGGGLGRGLVHAARYLKEGEDPSPELTFRPEAHELPLKLFGVIPKAWMWLMLKPFNNRLGMRFVNMVRYGLGRMRDRGRVYRQTLGAFNFLLDYVPNWKLVYRPGGFIQHQTFAPDAEAPRLFRHIIETCQRHGIPPYLAVFKRHQPDRFLLSHGLDGWSLALDLPVDGFSRGRILKLTAELDEAICQAGGRFYPAKDATLRPEHFQRSLPAENLERFRALKAELDPDGLLESDLYRRLFRDGPHSPGLL